MGGECSHHCATLAPSCGGLPFIMGLKLALPPMAFTIPYLSLFFELVFHLFFVGTVCTFFFVFFFYNEKCLYKNNRKITHCLMRARKSPKAKNIII